MSQVPFACQLAASTNAGWFAGQPELFQGRSTGAKFCRCRNPRRVFFFVSFSQQPSHFDTLMGTFLHDRKKKKNKSIVTQKLIAAQYMQAFLFLVDEESLSGESI